MFLSARNIYRLFRIARTLARHDALFPLEGLGVAKGVIAPLRLLARRKRDGRPGQRLARAMQKLGPSFIKLGQALSTRSDLVGEEVASDLSQLQDHLAPFPASYAKAAIEQELEIKLEDSFKEFENQPLAAASIAQVHLAITSEGKEVAVKILRPGIETAFKKDIELFFWVAELIEHTHPDLRRLKPVEVIRTFQETTQVEMDLRLEAAAAEEMEKNFAGDPTFTVPSVDWRRTAQRVLTLARVHGVPIDERELLIKQGFDPNEIVARAATALFKQVFRDGFFHADQHPGNLFVGEQGEIIAVDFGIMGRLDKSTRRYLGEMLMSFLNRDYSRVAEVHFEAGYVPSHKSVEAFTQACRAIGEPILDKPQGEISIARLLAQLFQITKNFEMETQPQLLLLQKTMLVAEGVGRKVAPEANFWFLAHPLIEKWITDNMGTEVLVAETIGEVAEGLKKIPRILSNMEQNTAAMARGGIKLHPNTIRNLNHSTESRWYKSPRLYIAAITILTIALILA